MNLPLGAICTEMNWECTLKLKLAGFTDMFLSPMDKTVYEHIKKEVIQVFVYIVLCVIVIQ